LARFAFQNTSQINEFSKSIKLIKDTCKQLLSKVLEHNDNECTKVEVIFKDISYDFNRLSADLSNCANLVETSLIDSGATLGKDFIKLDCYKLAMELIKNCV
jgi:hypothetical protein